MVSTQYSKSKHCRCEQLTTLGPANLQQYGSGFRTDGVKSQEFSIICQTAAITRLGLQNFVEKADLYSLVSLAPIPRTSSGLSVICFICHSRGMLQILDVIMERLQIDLLNPASEHKERTYANPRPDGGGGESPP